MAPPAVEEPLALLSSFVDRPRTRPPAPLDFPAPSPYPESSIAVWLLVRPAPTPSAESCYLSALTLFGGHQPIYRVCPIQSKT